MFATFAALTFWSFKNRLLRRIRRLREPRYLVGLIVGVLYLYFAFSPGRSSGSRRRVRAEVGLDRIAGPLQVLGSVALFVVTALAWIWPGARKPITFSRPEVQFLFTAPVSRRQLLHYRLIRSQFGMLFSSAVITLLARPTTLANGWMSITGLWVLFMALRLHLMGVALSRTSVAQHGRSGIARQWLPLALACGVAGVLVQTVISAWPGLTAESSSTDVLVEIERLGTTGAAGIVLWPFRTLVSLPFSPSPAAFFATLPWALGIVALNYLWVLRSDASFEEASAEAAEKQARSKVSSRPVVRGKMTTPFQLGLIGRPETAILWKNLIQIGRYISPRMLLRLLPVVIVFGLMGQSPGRGGVASVIAVVAAWIAAMLVMMGPQLVRTDLRQDLVNLPMLKTWPVSGAAIVRGEVLAPTLVLSGVVWLLIVLAGLLSTAFFAKTGDALPSMLDRISYVIGAAIVTPPILLAQTVVLNGIAVLWPAWSAVGASRARGIDAMGQRLLMMAGILLALVLSLLPGAAAAAALMFVVHWMTGITLIVLPALLIAGVVLVECWVATELLGRVLDRTDVAALDPVE
jgi:hypothetical protein